MQVTTQPTPLQLAGEIRRTSRVVLGLEVERVTSTEERAILANGQTERERRDSFRVAREEALREAATVSLWDRAGNCLATILSMVWVLILMNLIALLLYVELMNIIVLGQAQMLQCDKPLWAWLFFRIVLWETEMLRQEVYVQIRLLWNLNGWQYISSSVTCKMTDVQLYEWVKFVLLFDMMWVTIIVLAPILIMLGLHVFRHMVERGYIRNPNAATPETIARLQRIDFQEELFAPDGSENDPRPSRECCCCMEEFDSVKPIIVTPCKHYIHESCLEDWLKLARTCPICRNDLDAALQNPHP